MIGAARSRPTASTPPSWPRRSSRAATPTWCRWRGRSSPTPTSSTRRRRPRRRDQHLHRLQPGLPRPHLRAPGVLPGQSARAARPSSCCAPAQKQHRGGRAGPAGMAAAMRAAERGHGVTLFEATQRDRRPVQPGHAGSRARRSSPRRCATSTRARGARGGAAARRTGRPRLREDGFDRGARDRRRLRIPAIDGIAHPSVAATRTCSRARRTVGQSVAIDRRRRHRLRRRHFLTHDPSETVEDWYAHWGVGDSDLQPAD